MLFPNVSKINKLQNNNIEPFISSPNDRINKIEENHNKERTNIFISNINDVKKNKINSLNNIENFNEKNLDQSFSHNNKLEIFGLNEEEKSFSINFQYIFNNKNIEDRYDSSKIRNNNNNICSLVRKKLPKLNFSNIKKFQHLNHNLNNVFDFNEIMNSNKSNNLEEKNSNNINLISSPLYAEKSSNRNDYSLNNINKSNIYKSMPTGEDTNRGLEKVVNINNHENISTLERSRASSPINKKGHYKAMDKVFTEKFTKNYIEIIKQKRIEIEENKKLLLKKNMNLEKNELERYFAKSRINKNNDNILTNIMNKKYDPKINNFSIKDKKTNIQTLINKPINEQRNNQNNINKNSALFMTKVNSVSNSNPFDDEIQVNSNQDQKINLNADDRNQIILPKILESKINKSKVTPSTVLSNNNSSNIQKSKVDKSIELIRNKFKNRKKPFFDEQNYFSPDDTFQVRSKINKLVNKITKQFDDGKSLKKFVVDYDENFKVYNRQRLAYRKKLYI